VPVICVGNFVVGGAGKTPTAQALARLARSRGFRPGFLTRGYGGRETGPILVEPGKHDSLAVGDEPLLLASVAPTVVARDRAAGAEALIAAGIDLIVMDDGFQNPAIAKDLSLIVIDAATGIGNGMVTPSGPLRAPLGPQLRRADALVVVGEGAAAAPHSGGAARAGRATMRARIKPHRVKEWRKEPILAFAGIGRPEKFFDTLREIRAPVARTMSFPDHYRYTDADAERLLAHAAAANLRLVTTEKDMARLIGGNGALAQLREKAEALPVMLEFENSGAVADLVSEAAERVTLRRRG
jgi:tetraacyldisaccharide 4'-kinase